MKVVLYAGGFGQRLWPMSTEKSPKQFARIYNGKSTLDMCLDLFAGEYGWENMLIKIGDFEFTEVWDGVLYKKLSDYPKVSDWEIRNLIESS